MEIREEIKNGKKIVKWKDVEHIERTNDLTVTIKHQKYKTICEYETPQECLQGFLSLKKNLMSHGSLKVQKNTDEAGDYNDKYKQQN
jgi:hypothetical protein